MEPIYRKNDHSTLMTSSSGNSASAPRLDESTLDRTNPMFPKTEIQLGMLMRKACETSREIIESEPQITIDQSKWIMLEDRYAVIQKRNSVLITENKDLRDQLKNTWDKIRELENNISNSTTKLKENDVEKVEKKVEDRGISTTNFLTTMERGIQVWAVCRSCERKFEDVKSTEATAIITKSELESLEWDMQRLRDAVATRETDWNRSIERENCYREQLKRLAAETTTHRQLAVSRHCEIERLAQILAETERDLRSAQKEISCLKKIIVKLEKRQSREFDANGANFLEGNGNTSSDVNEKELKLIDDIEKQLSNAKNKQRSKQHVNKNRVILTSGTNSTSNQTSPRAQATSRSVEEPVTITEIFSKL